MKTLTLSMVLMALAIGSSALCAQQEAPKPASQATISQWVEQLGHDDYSKREEASKALRGQGEAARPALEQARDSKNLEQRQRARALIGALEAPQDSNGAGSAAQRLRSLRDQRRQQQRGISPSSPRMQRLQRVRPSPQPQVDKGGFESQMERLREQLEAMSEARRDASNFFGPGSGTRLEIPFMDMRGNSTTTSRTSNGNVTLEMTQNEKDGVTLKVLTRDPATGVTTEEIHQAPTMELFKERFPEVVEKHRASGVFDMGLSTFTLDLPGGIGGAFGFNGPSINHNGIDFAKMLEQLRAQGPGTRRQPNAIPGSPNRLVPGTPQPNWIAPDHGPKLGVVLSPVPSMLRAHVDLPKAALIIDEVQAGSVAEQMGLRPHDVITMVNGQAVGSALEVRKLLRQADGKVEVQIHRKGTTQTLSGELGK